VCGAERTASLGRPLAAERVDSRRESLHAPRELLHLAPARDVERRQGARYGLVGGVRQALALAGRALLQLRQAGERALPGLLAFAVDAAAPQLGALGQLLGVDAAAPGEGRDAAADGPLRRAQR